MMHAFDIKRGETSGVFFCRKTILVCTDSTEILFSKLRSELSLAKTLSISLFLTVQGVSNKLCLLTFFHLFKIIVYHILTLSCEAY